MITLKQLELLNIRPLNIEDELEEMLNMNFDNVELCDLSYQYGTTFRQVDEIAFREEAANYADACLEDALWTEIEGEYFLTESLPDEDEIEETL